jgi:hypothetical protein
VLATEGNLLGSEGNFLKVRQFLDERMSLWHLYDRFTAMFPTHKAQIKKVIADRVEPPLESHEITEIMRHITSPPGVCQHCRSALDDPGVSECPNCHALNIDW